MFTLEQDICCGFHTRLKKRRKLRAMAISLFNLIFMIAYVQTVDRKNVVYLSKNCVRRVERNHTIYGCIRYGNLLWLNARRLYARTRSLVLSLKIAFNEQVHFRFQSCQCKKLIRKLTVVLTWKCVACCWKENRGFGFLSKHNKTAVSIDKI